jgi:DNA-binding NarL/FixJ family response regulator
VERLATMAKPRIVVGDELRIFTDGLVRVLGGEYEVIGAPDGVQPLMALVSRIRPELVIKGLSANTPHGLGILRELRLASRETRILIVTQWEDPSIAAEAFRCGASAYVLQRCAPSELLDAVRAALAHKWYVTPRLASDAIQSLLTPTPAGNHPPTLTPRQRAVVKQLADGKSMKEVADALEMTARTVAFHKYRIMRRLNIRSTAELVRFAVKTGIV